VEQKEDHFPDQIHGARGFKCQVERCNVQGACSVKGCRGCFTTVSAGMQCRRRAKEVDKSEGGMVKDRG
jgi:hypothetical protein